MGDGTDGSVADPEVIADALLTAAGDTAVAGVLSLLALNEAPHGRHTAVPAASRGPSRCCGHSTAWTPRPGSGW